MSPLAHQIVKELTLPVRDRKIEDYSDLKHQMAGVHCFDFSKAMDVHKEVKGLLADQINPSQSLRCLGQKAFLPAPKTWIEFTWSYGRIGYLLEDRATGEHDRNVFCSAFIAIQKGSRITTSPCGAFPLSDEIAETDMLPLKAGRYMSDEYFGRDVARIYAALAIINTPRLIGRITRTPHRGLERALKAQQSVIGKYPLHAWSEITIEAFPKYTAADGTVIEAHLTGRKCLHFCRSHLRIRMGRLEIVSSHWRGDPALGIKRTRYNVVRGQAA